MFGELPKLFDRNFAIAFFLPSAAFILASSGLLAGFGLPSPGLPLLKGEGLQGLTTLGVIAWLGGVLLLVLNYNVYRILEGYGDFNPIKYLDWLERRRYARLQAAIKQAESEIEDGKRSGEEEEVLARIRARRVRLVWKAADQFPLRESRILPTAFGNTLRAFEDYPHSMYGVDSIVVWSRLLGVIPADYREMINTEKSTTDFWVNLRLLSFLLLIEYAGLVIYTRRLTMLWCPLLTLGVGWIAARTARTAAISWGDYVKGAFDLYLPDLREKLQLPAPADIDQERKLWRRFSRQVVFHRTEDVLSRAVAAPDDKEKKLSAKSAK